MADVGGDPNREVAIAFTVKGDAEQKASGLARAFAGVHRAADAAKARVNEVGRSFVVGAVGAAGLTLGLREIWAQSKEVNLSMDAMQKRIAGSTFAFATWKKGTTGLEKWRESMRDGVEITEKLEGVSRRHKVSREELVGIYASQAQMSERYRQSQAQQIDFSEKLAATQNVLGISAEGAGMMIARAAMTGAIQLRTQLGRQLAAGVGDLKAFKRASEEVRFEKLKKALGDMVPASQEMGKGMKGALFDLKEFGEEGLRDLTRPMFSQQTKSLRDWAANLTKIRDDGQSIVATYGEKLAKAFTTIKDVSGSIAQHWKLIAGLFVAGKLGGMAGGAIRAFTAPAAGAGAAGLLGGGTVGSMSIQAANVVVNSAGMGGAIGAATSAGVTKATSGGLARFASGLAAGASKAFIAAEAVGALAVAAAAWVDEWQTGKLKQQQVAPVQTMNALHAGITAMKTGGEEQARHLKGVSEAFGLKAGQHVSAAAIEAGLRTMPLTEAQKLARGYGFSGQVSANAMGEFAPHVAAQIAKNLNDLIDQAMKAHGAAFKETEEKSNKEKAARAAPVTNIGVVNLTQDFKADDPERIFHRAAREMVSELNQLHQHPDHSPAARHT